VLGQGHKAFARSVILPLGKKEEYRQDRRGRFDSPHRVPKKTRLAPNPQHKCLLHPLNRRGRNRETKPTSLGGEEEKKKTEWTKGAFSQKSSHKEIRGKLAAIKEN